MGLLAFSIDVALDGCIDHREGIAGHGPTLSQTGLPATGRLELISARPLRNGAVAMHYRRASTAPPAP